MGEQPPVSDLRDWIFSNKLGRLPVWSTYSAFEFSPGDCLGSQSLGRIIDQNPLLENMRLPFAEEAEAEERDRPTGGLGKGDQKVGSRGNGVYSLDLERSFQSVISKILVRPSGGDRCSR